MIQLPSSRPVRWYCGNCGRSLAGAVRLGEFERCPTCCEVLAAAERLRRGRAFLRRALAPRTARRWRTAAAAAADLEPPEEGDAPCNLN